MARNMIPRELRKPDTAAREAGRTYNRRIERQFALADCLLIRGRPDKAEIVAKRAALLRWYAASEVIV